MKRFFALVLLFSLCMTVFAFADTDAEISEIKAAVESDRLFYATMFKSLDPDVDVEEMEKKINADGAFRMYKLKPGTVLEDDYKFEKGFEALLSDEYVWIVPFYDENVYAEFRKSENGWEFSSAGSKLLPESSKGLTLDYEWINKLHHRASLYPDTDIENLKIVSLGSNGYAALFTVYGEERIIPLLFQHEDSTIINVYEETAHVFVEKYIKDYPTEQVVAQLWDGMPPDAAGGNTGTVRVVYDHIAVYILAAALLIVAAAVTAVILVKRKRR